MKVLLINNSSIIRGGADKVFLDQILLLRENGLRVETFCLDENEETLPSPTDFKSMSFVGRLKNVHKYFYNAEVARLLRMKLIEFRPDVVHLHLIYNGGLTSSVMKALKGCDAKIIMTVHDYKLTCPVSTHLNSSNSICEACINGSRFSAILNRCSQKSTGETSILNTIILTLESLYRDTFFPAEKLIDHFHFVSSFIAKQHEKKSKIYSRKGFVLYNTLPRRVWRETDHMKKYDLIYFGRLSEEKGIEMILRFAELERINLVVCGTGVLTHLVKKYADRNENIIYDGFRSGEALELRIRQSRFSILNSIWYENNPLSVLESMSLGVPVLASNLGGIPEIIEDSINGYLFDGGSLDSIREKWRQSLCLSPNEYDEMSTKAVTRVREMCDSETILKS